MRIAVLICLTQTLACFFVSPVIPKMNTSVKNLTLREENPFGAKERLTLPYAFSTEGMGLTFGIGTMAHGNGQDQLTVVATVFASVDDAAGFIGGVWDLRLPHTHRLFLTLTGSAGYYPRKRAYSAPSFSSHEPRPGGNDSSEYQFIEVGGNDQWIDIRLEYVLPIGAAAQEALMTYKLKGGMLTSEPTGGRQWNPLKSGVTNVLLRQYNRYQDYQFESGDLEQSIRPIQIAISYDNTDFPANPSFGSRQFIGVTHNPGWGGAKETWTFWELEASKFFSLGSSHSARQRVLALDFWTGDTPTWNETRLPGGDIKVNNAPPYYEGATLGGFYKMRAYPFDRFNDRSVIYTSAEYRYTPRRNPLGEVRWLRFLKMDWWQFVGFVEGGRVANEYTLKTLTSHWKVDAGMSIRAMVAGGLIRFDVAVSNEGTGFWAMVGHPF